MINPVKSFLTHFRGRTNTQEMKVLPFFAVQVARPSRGSDDHVKWRSRFQLET